MENAHVKVKLGVIGVGMMGALHARDVYDSDLAELVSVCDIDEVRAERIGKQYDADIYFSYEKMLVEAGIDGVIVATPHYDHTPISIAALEKGIHVLTEKPIAVHVNDAKKMIAAYERARKQFPELVFAAMFQQRTYGFWQKIKTLIDEGELGRLLRTTWIITDWFRTQSYYNGGGWRATWEGEGGGVLLNQCPHNIDLYQWFVGMPQRVTGFAAIGKYHNIEVEDEVTAFFEYDSGMVGHFITTTAESPGTNRLEIVGENGKLVFEGGKLTFYRNRYSALEQIGSAPGAYDKVENWIIDVPFTHHGEPGHRFVIENFVRAIVNGENLIAPAAEGLHSIMLGNAMIFSALTGQKVDLPLDGDAYAAKLRELIEKSDFQKTVRVSEQLDGDMSKSF